MNKQAFQKFLPHLVAFLLFSVISFVYLSPILEGKSLTGHDTKSWSYMAKETVDYNATHDKPTLWTGSMFGGMPTYQITMNQPNNFMMYVENIMRIFPGQVFFLMLYLLCFYILLLSFRVDPWLSMIGSIAFTFASYNFIILVAGHNSKAITIAYMAALIGAVYLAFRDKKIVGGLMTAFFASLAIRANHVQILYYALIILIFMGLVELIYSIVKKEMLNYAKSIGVLVVAGLIAVGMNATSLLTTYEYSKATMRGETNGLTADKQNSQNGLSPDYITQWSYGIGETFTVLIPDFKGGASGAKLTVDSETGKKLSSLGVPDVSSMMNQQMFPMYWGTQPGTSGPVYFGAIVCFLFVLGLFLVEGRIKWWVLPMILLTLMLSWGKNCMWLTDFFINHVPMYNKFRTPSMTLVATGFGVALLAILALKEVFAAKDKKKLLKPIYISAGITAGLALIFALIPSLSGDFSSAADAQFSGDYSFLRETLPLDRAAHLRADALRSMIFILISAAVLCLYINDKIKSRLAMLGLGVLFLFDFVPVDKRYLNNDLFVYHHEDKSETQASAADNFIFQDKSDFRVLDASLVGMVNNQIDVSGVFNDASPSYFHKNIGGYHAAKLRRYQELINMHLSNQIAQFCSVLYSGKVKSMDQLLPVFKSLGVINMLNTKYIIYNKQAAPIVNPCANGNAWFVKNIRIASDANEEMKMLGQIDTKSEMVVDKEYASQLPQHLSPDTTAHIALKSYEPNHMVYTVNSKTDQVAVFSEIFYDKGWTATINGQEVPFVRADYLLRAMPLKAGNYEVVFSFNPSSYSVGNTIALICSFVLVLSILAYFVITYKKSKSVEA